MQGKTRPDQGKAVLRLHCFHCQRVWLRHGLGQWAQLFQFSGLGQGLSSLLQTDLIVLYTNNVCAGGQLYTRNYLKTVFFACTWRHYVSLGAILVDFKVLSSRLHRNSWVTLIFLVCLKPSYCIMASLQFLAQYDKEYRFLVATKINQDGVDCKRAIRTNGVWWLVLALHFLTHYYK
jgi:hypothetical protein